MTEEGSRTVERKQPVSRNVRRRLTELMVICTTAGGWGRDDLQATWSHLDLSERITIFRNDVNEVCEEGRLKPLTLRLTNIETTVFIVTALAIDITWLFQVDANAFSVEFSNVSFNINYAQSVADIRAVARAVARSVPSAHLIWQLYENSRPLVFGAVFCSHSAPSALHGDQQ